MLVVIEGVDLVGKSRLAEELAQQTRNARIIHAGPPTRHPLEEYETALAAYNPHGEETLILDRWHIGETVWPHIFGRESKMDLPMFRHVDMFLESRGAYVVYAERDPELLKVELVERNEPLPPQLLGDALSLFEGSLLEMTCPYERWDYTCGDLHQRRMILAEADHYQEAAKYASYTTTDWVGSPCPSLLLVGDRWGPEKEDRDPPPVPFAPYADTSGHYLMKALPRNLRRKVALINAWSGREPNLIEQDLLALHADMSHPKVAALGKEAQKACDKAGLESFHIPHPQYWRRFNYAQVNEYMSLIKEALRT